MHAVLQDIETSGTQIVIKSCHSFLQCIHISGGVSPPSLSAILSASSLPALVATVYPLHATNSLPQDLCLKN